VLFVKKVLIVALVATLGITVLGIPASQDSQAAPKTKVKVTSIPAAGNATSGTYVTYAPGSNGTSRTKMDLPQASGTALLGDWNGDGVATPGRYTDGAFWITNKAVDSPAWEEMFTLGGQPGDIPVTGDADGDGKDDLGIFNSGSWQWLLRSGASKTDTFGQVGDIPVVGNWDGKGADNLGVYRAGLWQLRFVGEKRPKFVGKKVPWTKDPNSHFSVASITVGLPADVPVAGDWNGTGRATPGLVRGSRWFFMKNLKKPKKTTHRDFDLPSGAIPLVGTRVGGITACPTTTIAAATAGNKLQATVRSPLVLKGNRAIEGNREIALTLEDGVAFAIRNDTSDRLLTRINTTYYDPISTEKTMEESIRRNANLALSAATLLSTTTLPSFDGIKRTEVVDYALWHIRSIACQHASNSLGGWGNSWQSALWSTTTAQAAWLSWNELNTDEKAMVSNMVQAEANFVAQRGPRYFRDRVGVEISPGNSQADEVSWDLLAPVMAQGMFTRNSQLTTWRDSGIALAIAAFSRPGDLTQTKSVNGVNVALRLPGTNANEDGTVTNHGIVNPDYTQNVQHLWWAATLLRAAKISVPEAFFYNADIVYRALSVVEFPSPPYAEPGGTVYKPLGQIYYPMGISWGVRRPATFVGVDGFANVYSAPDTKAGEFLAAHARDTRALQMRWTDGRIYAEGNAEDSYKLGKEEYAMQQLALAWWAGSWKFGPKMQVDYKSYPNIRLDRGYGPDCSLPYQVRRVTHTFATAGVVHGTSVHCGIVGKFSLGIEFQNLSTASMLFPYIAMESGLLPCQRALVS